MITTCRGDKATVKDVRLTMKQFVDSLRNKKEHGLVRKMELVSEKRGKKNLERERTATESDDSVSSSTKSNLSPQSTPVSSPPLSPRLFLVAPTPMHQAQLTTSHLLQLNDDTTREDDSSHNDDWGQFTCIE